MGHVGSSRFDSTIVVLDTDEGVTGYGEMAVINAAYGDQFAAGARAGIGELAPLLHRARSDATARRARRARRRDAGAAVRQVGARHGVLGHHRQGRRPSALRGARCALRRRGPALQRRHRAPARRGGGARARARRRGLPAAPGQGRPGARGRRRAARRRARRRRPGHRALRRRKRRLHRRVAQGGSSARPATSSTRSSSRAAPTPSAPPCGPRATGRSFSTSRS